MADINTGGGTGIGGDANTGGGDLVGRDQEQGNARSRSSASQKNIVNVNRDAIDNLYTDVRFLEEAINEIRFTQYQHGVSINQHGASIENLRQTQLKPTSVGFSPEAVMIFGFMLFVLVLFIIAALFWLSRG